MTYFYESYEDYVLSGGVITDGLREMMDDSDILDMHNEDFDDSEYRDNRDDSARLAERHYC